ncbi:MAG: hypothetical protein SF187_18935 [Deltaproteobacteria bacterium]|nr:hypothetical protein [Deltaproteobacteria bacterium]
MSADYFATITLADYAGMAFGADPTGKPSASFEGGVYAGKGTTWERRAEADTAANARLVPGRP